MRIYFVIPAILAALLCGCATAQKEQKVIIVKESRELTEVRQLMKNVDAMEWVGKFGDLKDKLTEQLIRVEDGIQTGELTPTESQEIFVKTRTMMSMIRDFQPKTGSSGDDRPAFGGAGPGGMGKPPSGNGGVGNGPPPGGMEGGKPDIVKELRNLIDKYIENNSYNKPATQHGDDPVEDGVKQ
ncbi:MAG: hypothetical protein LLG37_03760 [Spirochaetia bacterium]|nr:hypothetical protein [Spirochaetia bacterium]